MKKLGLLTIVIASIMFFASCKQPEKKLLTKNGYEYILNKSGNGAKLEVGNYAYFHFQMVINDSIWDDTRRAGRLLKIKIDDIPAGKATNPILDVLSSLSVGDSINLFLPVDSIPSPPKILDSVDMIVYRMYIEDTKTADEYQAELNIEKEKMAAKSAEYQAKEGEIAEKVGKIIDDFNSGKLNSEIKSTGSGLKYLVLEEGSGDFPKKGNMVSVHYYGVLNDGKPFDNSFSRGKEFEFVLGSGQVIKAWDEGLGLFRKGGKGVLFVPPSLGYGATGAGNVIPPDADLLFYIELNDFK